MLKMLLPAIICLGVSALLSVVFDLYQVSKAIKEVKNSKVPDFRRFCFSKYLFNLGTMLCLAGLVLQHIEYLPYNINLLMFAVVFALITMPLYYQVKVHKAHWLLKVFLLLIIIAITALPLISHFIFDLPILYLLLPSLCLVIGMTLLVKNVDDKSTEMSSTILLSQTVKKSSANVSKGSERAEQPKVASTETTKEESSSFDSRNS